MKCQDGHRKGSRAGQGGLGAFCCAWPCQCCRLQGCATSLQTPHQLLHAESDWVAEGACVIAMPCANDAKHLLLCNPVKLDILWLRCILSNHSILGTSAGVAVLPLINFACYSARVCSACVCLFIYSLSCDVCTGSWRSRVGALAACR